MICYSKQFQVSQFLWKARVSCSCTLPRNSRHGTLSPVELTISLLHSHFYRKTWNVLLQSFTIFNYVTVSVHVKRCACMHRCLGAYRPGPPEAGVIGCDALYGHWDVNSGFWKGTVSLNCWTGPSLQPLFFVPSITSLSLFNLLLLSSLLLLLL